MDHLPEFALIPITLPIYIGKQYFFSLASIGFQSYFLSQGPFYVPGLGVGLVLAKTSLAYVSFVERSDIFNTSPRSQLIAINIKRADSPSKCKKSFCFTTESILETVTSS